jgi:hypothetical protein
MTVHDEELSAGDFDSVADNKAKPSSSGLAFEDWPGPALGPAAA